MRRLFRRLHYVFRQDDHEAALAEELEFHRAMTQRALEAGGLPPDAARVQSSRALGNVTRAREDARAEWIWPWAESVWQDARLAVRALLRQPGFTLLSVVILGVAIGLNTSLFTVFAGLALRPMAGLTDASRVVAVSGMGRVAGRRTGMGYPEFRYLAAQSRTITGLSALRATSVTLETGSESRSTVTYAVSGSYFDTLGVRMERGRGFRPREDREDAPLPVVVLSYRLWQARFAADPAIVGSAARINDAAYTVVGVASREFGGKDGAAMALWVPIASLPVLRPHDPGERNLLTQADDCCVDVIGRLRPPSAATRPPRSCSCSAIDSARACRCQRGRSRSMARNSWTDAAVPLRRSPSSASSFSDWCWCCCSRAPTSAISSSRVRPPGAVKSACACRSARDVFASCGSC